MLQLYLCVYFDSRNIMLWRHNHIESLRILLLEGLLSFSYHVSVWVTDSHVTLTHSLSSHTKRPSTFVKHSPRCLIKQALLRPERLSSCRLLLRLLSLGEFLRVEMILRDHKTTIDQKQDKTDCKPWSENHHEMERWDCGILDLQSFPRYLIDKSFRGNTGRR